MNPTRVAIRVRLNLVRREAALHNNIKLNISHMTMMEMIYSLRKKLRVTTLARPPPIREGGGSIIVYFNFSHPSGSKRDKLLIREGKPTPIFKWTVYPRLMGMGCKYPTTCSINIE